MNLPPEGIEPYLKALEVLGGEVRIVVAPPFPYLRDIASKTRLTVAAQNCSDQEKGAFTGEVAASMIRDCGASFVIIGHSERRTLYGETDAMVARKLAVAIAAGLVPVLCIGEDLHTREAGHVASFLAGQIRATAAANLDAAKEIVIAYEPIWAIGTGKNATGLMCAETIADTRSALERFWPRRHANAPILYGGSVTVDNIQELETSGDVDGFLVGGASLDSARFLSILRGMQRP